MQRDFASQLQILPFQVLFSIVLLPFVFVSEKSFSPPFPFPDSLPISVSSFRNYRTTRNPFVLSFHSHNNLSLKFPLPSTFCSKNLLSGFFVQLPLYSLIISLFSILLLVSFLLFCQNFLHWRCCNIEMVRYWIGDVLSLEQLRFYSQDDLKNFQLKLCTNIPQSTVSEDGWNPVRWKGEPLLSFVSLGSTCCYCSTCNQEKCPSAFCSSLILTITASLYCHFFFHPASKAVHHLHEFLKELKGANEK